ncbi:MAG: hypothetical protein WCJ64_04710 [Rhodospirillaceae bacterium]
MMNEKPDLDADNFGVESTIEYVLIEHIDIQECVVVHFRDGSPFAFLVVKDGATTPPDEIIKQAISMVHGKIGDTANFSRALVVSRLPKARSGKILRFTLQKILDKGEAIAPPFIDDVSVLPEITSALKAHGYLIQP